MIGVPTVALFYAILAVVANVAVAGIVVGVLAGRGERLRDALGGSALPAAFVVALLATAGSLWFSEVAHFEPCRLCWFQRIAMYPLVVILGIAAWRRDAAVRRYVAPLAIIGAVIATYHYALEWFPALDTGSCSVSAPCTLVWFRELGFITLPYLALSAFLLILALVWLPRTEPDRDDLTDGDPT
jgi:disulfide bond formation protein DsbB